MSIIAYTGLPGSGKSYSVVEHQILPALKAGRHVCTNLPMKKEELDQLQLPGSLTEFPVEAVGAEPHRIKEYVTPGCVWILDEAWRLFPQGQQANKVPDDFKSLLAEHRHMVDGEGNSTQIVFVVQDLANIGAFARRLVENTFVTTKLGFVGLDGSYRVDIFHGAQTGATPPVSNRLRMITGRYKKEIFALYKSHTMSQTGEAGNETKIDKRANILRRPAFIVGAICCPILIWFSLHTFANAFHSAAVGPKHPAADQAGTGSRSGAERGQPGPGSSEGKFVEPSSPRLLLDLYDHQTKIHRGVLAVGRRLVMLGGSECRTVYGKLECAYRGVYYDAAGAVL